MPEKVLSRALALALLAQFSGTAVVSGAEEAQGARLEAQVAMLDPVLTHWRVARVLYVCGGGGGGSGLKSKFSRGDRDGRRRIGNFPDGRL